MPERLEDLFAQHGLDLLGHADTAFVFARPESPDLVVKVGVDVADGWPAWAVWCATQASPHLPRIRSCSWVHDPAGRPVLFVGVLERLRPTSTAKHWLRQDLAFKRDPLALAERLEAERPSIAAMLRAACAAFPQGHWDMGAANWMERADGTLVLTDPLSIADRTARRAA